MESSASTQVKECRVVLTRLLEGTAHPASKEASADLASKEASADLASKEASADPASKEASADLALKELSADPASKEPLADPALKEPSVPEKYKLNNCYVRLTRLSEDFPSGKESFPNFEVQHDEEIEQSKPKLRRNKKRRSLRVRRKVIEHRNSAIPTRRCLSGVGRFSPQNIDAGLARSISMSVTQRSARRRGRARRSSQQLKLDENSRALLTSIHGFTTHVLREGKVLHPLKEPRVDVEEAAIKRDLEENPFVDAFRKNLLDLKTSAWRKILLKEELKSFAVFGQLSAEAFSLYISLLGQGGLWIREEDLKKRCKNLESISSELLDAGLIRSDPDEKDTEQLLNLLNTKELDSLGCCLNIRFGSRKKKFQVQTLKRNCEQLNRNEELLTRLREVLGLCVRLTALPKEAMDLFLVAQSAWLPAPCSGNRLGAVRNHLTARCFARPLLIAAEDDDDCSCSLAKEVPAFESRADIIRWADVAGQRAHVEVLFRSSSWQEAESLCGLWMQGFRDILQESSSTSKSQAIIAGALAEALERSTEIMCKAEKFDLALEVFQLLLEQRLYRQERRFVWLVGLSALHQKMNNRIKAAKVLLDAWEDLPLETESPSGGAGARRRLQQQMRQVVAAPRARGETLPDELRGKLESLMGDAPPEPKRVTLSATVRKGAPGMKQVYVRKSKEDGNVNFLSVEEVAMEHFLSKGTFSKGLDDEGETLVSLCVLALWDCIYCRDGGTRDGGWGSALQDRPLDWGTRDFCSRKRGSLQRRLAQMRGQDAASLAADLVEARDAMGGTRCLVRWDLLGEDLDIEEVLQCLTVAVFVSICERLVSDFSSNRSGFPDVFLWNPIESKSLFLEVKGSQDRLSASQLLWLEFLQSVGAETAVAKVRPRN